VRNGHDILTERMLNNLEMWDIEGDSHTQEIVPPVLIDHFVSMASPMARAVDSEISHHCAFSLPAVVLTLGRENWPLLKKT
jgi:serine/threonine-protein phosphatase 4 regulatory subunit 1